LLNWHRWWLPVAIAAMLLIGIAALIVPTQRRRRAAGRHIDVTEGGGAVKTLDTGEEALTESVSPWSADADSDVASARLSDGYRSPIRPRTVRLPNQPVSDWMASGDADSVDEPASEEGESISDEERFDDDHYHDDHYHDDHYDEDHYDEERFDDEHFDEDPDAVDTAPTLIPTPSEVRHGRHAAADAADDDDTTHFAAFVPIAPGQLAIHLPLDDPYEVPEGYPVKANASFGVYYMPDSALYEDTLAEIWFCSEEIAQANGFTKAQ
jgi:uncharacterized protein with LGFP repeats